MRREQFETFCNALNIVGFPRLVDPMYLYVGSEHGYMRGALVRSREAFLGRVCALVGSGYSPRFSARIQPVSVSPHAAIQLYRRCRAAWVERTSDFISMNVRMYEHEFGRLPPGVVVESEPMTHGIPYEGGWLCVVDIAKFYRECHDPLKLPKGEPSRAPEVHRVAGVSCLTTDCKVVPCDGDVSDTPPVIRFVQVPDESLPAAVADAVREGYEIERKLRAEKNRRSQEWQDRRTAFHRAELQRLFGG